MTPAIAAVNMVVRGWGNYFRTGNAADKFDQVDRYVVWLLKRLLVKRYGRNLHAGHPDWTREWFEGHGLYRLGAPSAIRGQRNHVTKTIGKPCAGEPHARFERG